MGRRYSDNGVIPIAIDEARHLAFPAGHPRKELAYAQHPARSNTYLPVASFHPSLFEDKFVELIRILTGIGAVLIEVRGQEGWKRDEMSLSEANIADLGAIGLSPVSARSESSQSEMTQHHMMYKATLSGNASRTLPQDLAWYNSEPSWKEIVRQRYDNALEGFSLLLEYKTDYRVNSSLASTLLAANLLSVAVSSR